MIAKMFDEYTMSGSSVMPKTAGMESTAKTTSESSMTHRHSNSGVAIFAPFSIVKKLSPSYSVLTGRSPLQNFTIAFSDMSSSSSSSPSAMSLYELKIRTPAKTSRMGLKFVTASYPAMIIAARITIAPHMP